MGGWWCGAFARTHTGYHNVLAPNATWRRAIVPAAPAVPTDRVPGAAEPEVLSARRPRTIHRILAHLGLSEVVGEPLAARAPPGDDWTEG